MLFPEIDNKKLCVHFCQLVKVALFRFFSVVLNKTLTFLYFPLAGQLVLLATCSVCLRFLLNSLENCMHYICKIDAPSTPDVNIELSAAGWLVVVPARRIYVSHTGPVLHTRMRYNSRGDAYIQYIHFHIIYIYTFHSGIYFD